jgi:hypothetical protein
METDAHDADLLTKLAAHEAHRVQQIGVVGYVRRGNAHGTGQRALTLQVANVASWIVVRGSEAMAPR